MKYVYEIEYEDNSIFIYKYKKNELEKIQSDLVYSRNLKYINLDPESKKMIHSNTTESDKEILFICMDIYYKVSSTNEYDDIKNILISSYIAYDPKKLDESINKQEKLDILLKHMKIEEEDIETKYKNILDYFIKIDKLYDDYDIRLSFRYIIECYLNDNYKLINGYRFKVTKVNLCDNENLKKLNASLVSGIEIEVLYPFGFAINEKTKKNLYDNTIYFDAYHLEKLGSYIDFKKIDNVIRKDITDIIDRCKVVDRSYSRNSVQSRYSYAYKRTDDEKERVRADSLSKNDIISMKKTHLYIKKFIEKNKCIGLSYNFCNEVHFREDRPVYPNEYCEGVDIYVEFYIPTSDLSVQTRRVYLSSADRLTWIHLNRSGYREVTYIKELETEILELYNEFRDVLNHGKIKYDFNRFPCKVNRNFYNFICNKFLYKSNIFKSNTKKLNIYDIDSVIDDRKYIVSRIKLEEKQRIEEGERIKEQQKIEEEQKRKDKIECKLKNKLLNKFKQFLRLE